MALALAGPDKALTPLFVPHGLGNSRKARTRAAGTSLIF